jgi:hypothetical protein
MTQSPEALAGACATAGATTPNAVTAIHSPKNEATLRSIILPPNFLLKGYFSTFS